jgi:hypothetical protein
MTRAEYDAIPAVNYSLLKDLSVSPLRAWYKHIRPGRDPITPTAEMELGTALHCAVLTPIEFDRRYVCDITPPEDALETIEDIRNWIRSKGSTPKGTRKAEVIAQCYAMPGHPPVVEILREQFAVENAGKVIVKHEDWERIIGMALALADEPVLVKMLEQGEPDKCLEAIDSDTGLRLKGLLDWDESNVLDLKTFTVKHGRTVDKSVADAIWYEKYYLQAIFYSKLKGWPKWKGDFVFAFVESDPPHETRLRAIRPGMTGAPNLLWQRGVMEIKGLLRTFKDCMEYFGVYRPWRYACQVTEVEDQEIPGVMY